MSKTETGVSNRQVTTMKKTIKDQSEKISSLIMTVSSLTDEVADLKNDLLKLRENVGADLQDLYDKTSNIRQ